MVCQGELEIVQVEIQSDEDDANFWVQKGSITCRDTLVVFGLDVATVCGVCAADEGDVLGAQLLFNAGFADYVDFAFVLGEL